MPVQVCLPGLDEPPRLFRPEAPPAAQGLLRDYLLFLAIFPEPADAQRLAQVGRALLRQHGLSDAALQAGRLHISLQSIAAFDGPIPQAVLDASVVAAARVGAASLPVVFDRVLSFSRSNAFVMRCDGAGDAAIARLRQLLALELRRVGLRARPSGTPHMTLHYNAASIPEQAIAPLRWTATRFALILSHRGLTHHQWIAEWRLPERR